MPKPYGRVPAASVVQPTNTLPSRVGSAGFVTVCPYSTVAEVTDVPSFELKVTVYVFGVHLAYSVRSPVTGVPKPYGRVPAASVLHPANVYPVRVGLAGAEAFSPSPTSCASTALPPVESNVTLCATAHCAYSVTGAVTTLLKSYGWVPSASVVQRTNLKPSFVGAAGLFAVPPNFTVCAPIGEPPCESKVTPVAATGCAYTVGSPLKIQNSAVPAARSPACTLITDSGIWRSLSSQSLPVHDEPPLRMMNQGSRTPLPVCDSLYSATSPKSSCSLNGVATPLVLSLYQLHRSQPFQVSDSMS